MAAARLWTIAMQPRCGSSNLEVVCRAGGHHLAAGVHGQRHKLRGLRRRHGPEVAIPAMHKSNARKQRTASPRACAAQLLVPSSTVCCVCVWDFASVWTPRRGRSPTTGRIRCPAAQRQASQRHTHTVCWRTVCWQSKRETWRAPEQVKGAHGAVQRGRQQRVAVGQEGHLPEGIPSGQRHGRRSHKRAPPTTLVRFPQRPWSMLQAHTRTAVTGAAWSVKVTKQKPLDTWNSLTCMPTPHAQTHRRSVSWLSRTAGPCALHSFPDGPSLSVSSAPRQRGTGGESTRHVPHACSARTLRSSLPVATSAPSGEKAHAAMSW